MLPPSDPPDDHENSKGQGAHHVEYDGQHLTGAYLTGLAATRAHTRDLGLAKVAIHFVKLIFFNVANNRVRRQGNVKLIVT